MNISIYESIKIYFENVLINKEVQQLNLFPGRVDEICAVIDCARPQCAETDSIQTEGQCCSTCEKEDFLFLNLTLLHIF